MQRVDRRIKNQRDKIKQGSEARKSDRRARNDEITVKYGNGSTIVANKKNRLTKKFIDANKNLYIHFSGKLK